jgi:TonB family protein
MSFEEGRQASVLVEILKNDSKGRRTLKRKKMVLWDLKHNRRLKAEDVLKLTTISEFTQAYGGTDYRPYIKSEGLVHLRFTKDDKSLDAEFNPKTHPEHFQTSFLQLMGYPVPEAVKTQEMASDGTDNKVNEIVDVLPQYKGGPREMNLYLSTNIRYPVEAMKASREGKVYVSFVVNKQGNLQDVRIAKGVSPELDAEALRIVSNMPQWTPGIIAGKPVLTRMTLPIKFSINGEKKEEPKNELAKEVPAEKPKETPALPEPVKQDKTFVVIIANEHYQEEQPVEYALNDGEQFHKCCIEVLGIPKENVHLRKDATLNHIRHELQWLKDVAAAYQGEAHIIVYYAGHGVPNEATHSSYLLPVDGMASSIITGYSLDTFYEQLAQLNAQDVLIFLDACFSGANRGKGMLTSSRGVAMKPKSNIPNGKLIVFSATQGDETAFPFREKEHGLFTYYLIDKINNAQGTLSLGDLQKYVSTEVLRKSVVINRKRQTPCINTSSGIGATWQDIRLK